MGKVQTLTEEKSENIKAVVAFSSLDFEDVLKKFQMIESKIKFQAFVKASTNGQTKIKGGPKAGPTCPIRGLAKPSLLPLWPAEENLKKSDRFKASSGAIQYSSRLD